MRLYEMFNTQKRTRINEGGAMPGVGAIHKSEIEPTLSNLEKTLGVDLRNNTLGSVGKREFSGDIDVAIDISREELPAFVQKLEQNPLVLDIAKSSVIMTKVKIENYDDSKQTDRERTGYVQIDFMPGDPSWMKTYYHAPRETESKYKGVYRNILIASIAAVHEYDPSNEVIDDGRPTQVDRWMWSPADGLVRVRRTPVPKKSGQGYTKKNNNEVLISGIKTADAIAKALGLDTAADLNSYESLRSAMDKNYPNEKIQKILANFVDNSIIKELGIPEDLQ